MVKSDQLKFAEPGIDYNPLTTAEAVPIGSGFVAEGIVQYWQPDRFFVIDNQSRVSLDEKGFRLNPISHHLRKGDMDSLVIQQILLKVWELTPGDTSKHSPLLGWAFDGNPIYGSVGYANKKDDTAGFVQYQSSYSVTTDRSSVSPLWG